MDFKTKKFSVKIRNFSTNARDFYLSVLAFVDIKFFNLMNKINKNWKNYNIKAQTSLIKKLMYTFLIFHLVILILLIYLIPIEIITVFPIPDGLGSTKSLMNYETVIMIFIIAIVILIFAMYCFHLIEIIHVEELITNETNED